MQSVNITKGRVRWYEDACGIALALDLVGERWSLLIMRELMFGGRRFGELRATLTGISANVLTQRLAGLKDAGILRRRKLPPPASAQIYELTDWGYESERAIRELGRWAIRSPRYDVTLPLSAASLMMSFRTNFSAKRADGLKAKVAFRLGDDMFLVSIKRGEIRIRREADFESAGVLFATDPMTMASVVYGGRPLADAESGGGLAVEGDRALAARYLTLFPLPAKLG